MWAFLSANFVNPGLLAGAAGVAVPILIWLFSRLRSRTVEWAAMEFLLRAVRKTQRRLRIENLLLLIIRCLIVILIAIAVARPRGKVLDIGGEDARQIVIVLDASYSMGFQIGTTEADTVFARARERAGELINGLDRKDRVLMAVLTDSFQLMQDIPRAMDAQGKLDALEVLKDPEFNVSARGASGSALLRSLPAALEKFESENTEARASLKTVFFFSDHQRSLFFKANALRDPSLTTVADRLGKLGAELVMVDCGQPKPINVAITRVGPRDPVVGVGIPCDIEVQLQNFDTDEVAGLGVELYIDDLETPVKRSSVTIEGQKVLDLEPFRYEFRDPGPHRVQLRFSSDRLTIDNSRSVIIDVREAVQILLVDGDPYSGARKWEDEVHYLRGALEPGGPGSDLLRPTVITEAELGEQELERYDLIFLANVATLPDNAVSLLETYARTGGVVVFSLGERINESFYNQRLYRAGSGVFPISLGERIGRRAGTAATDVTQEWEFELSDKSWPPLQLFGDKEMRKWLKYPTVYRYVQVEARPEKPFDGRVLVEFLPRAAGEGDDGRVVDPKSVQAPGQPALVERAFGRGLTLALLTSLDADWNNAPAYDLLYVLWWRRVALHLSQAASPQRQLAIGDSFEVFIDQRSYTPEVRILRPDGQPTIQAPQEVKGIEERFSLSFNNTQKPGIYTVELGEGNNRRNVYFAVNVDAAEGDLEKLGRDDLKDALPGFKTSLKDEASLKEVLASATETTGANEQWRHVVSLLLALLVFESILAMFLGRRRQ